jgi:hypothetical protein
MSTKSSSKPKDAANSRHVFLVLLWSFTVMMMARFCVIELRVLKTAKEFSQQQHKTVRKKNEPNMNSTGDSTKNATDFRLSLLTKGASDGTAQLTIAAGLTEEHSNDDIHDSGVFDHGHNDEQQNNTGAIHTRKKKGHLILHVGPAKTATTTLQTDLTASHDRGWLIHDQMWYAGRYYRPYMRPATGELNINRSESALLTATRRMLYRCPDANKTACCVAFASELEALYKSKWHEHQKHAGSSGDTTFYLTVVVSDEAFMNMWKDVTDYRAIAAVVADQWDVTIVAGYRHFYEWILSSKYQRDRTDRISNYGKVFWPATGTAATDLDSPSRGRALLPMFPDTFLTWRRWYHYTDSVVRNANGTFAVRLLNLHAGDSAGSLLTQFLCDLVDDAPTACALSRQRDVETTEKTIMNSQEHTAIPSLYYDAVATAAADAGFIDTVTYKRCDMREAARAYHEETLGLTSNDLILQCPTSEELEALYDVSITMERQYILWRKIHTARDSYKRWPTRPTVGSMRRRSSNSHTGWTFLRSLV